MIASPSSEAVRCGVTHEAGAGAAVRALWSRIGPAPGFEPAFAVVFLSPRPDLEALAAAFAALPGAPVIMGCTTAGEIGPQGYTEGALVGMSFSAAHFRASSALLPELAAFAVSRGEEFVRAALAPLGSEPAPGRRRFALCLVDSFSKQEEAFVSAAGAALGPTPLFGGSAGDGLRFGESFILHGGRFHPDAALLAVVETDLPFEVFRFDHFEATGAKMVVTEADPERRIVREINAEPAAPEYARMVGVDPKQLSPFAFAAHPVVVRVGGEHHVRSIQRVIDGRDLQFYCAIDEGMVLTVARGRSLAEDLEQKLAALAPPEDTEAVLGFDCILRRLEAEQLQQKGRVSEILRRHKVIGFNTYGEQYRSLHANQTFTGVALRKAKSAS